MYLAYTLRALWSILTLSGPAQERLKKTNKLVKKAKGNGAGDAGKEGTPLEGSASKADRSSLSLKALLRGLSGKSNTSNGGTRDTVSHSGRAAIPEPQRVLASLVMHKKEVRALFAAVRRCVPQSFLVMPASCEDEMLCASCISVALVPAEVAASAVYGLAGRQ